MNLLFAANGIQTEIKILILILIEILQFVSTLFGGCLGPQFSAHLSIKKKRKKWKIIRHNVVQNYEKWEKMVLIEKNFEQNIYFCLLQMRSIFFKRKI